MRSGWDLQLLSAFAFQYITVETGVLKTDTGLVGVAILALKVGAPIVSDAARFCYPAFLYIWLA